MPKKFLNLKENQTKGLLLILGAGLIWYIRPFQDCAWYNVFCQAGALGTGSLFGIIALILVIGGAYNLLK